MGINYSLESNQYKISRPSDPGYSIKACIMLFMKWDKGCLQGVSFLRCYRNVMFNVFTLIGRSKVQTALKKAQSPLGFVYLKL